ncbi:hypothetical protein U1Q18_021169 [Sarracenia purpurea var. burkii]
MQLQHLLGPGVVLFGAADIDGGNVDGTGHLSQLDTELKVERRLPPKAKQRERQDYTVQQPNFLNPGAQMSVLEHKSGAYIRINSDSTHLIIGILLTATT